MRTLHLVTHTHWDREWYLTFQQFRLKLVHLVDDLLDILDKDPLFASFLLDGQTIALDDYLLMRPDRRSDLCKYIQAGRIIIGPWHILPDEFLVSPEATIRNLLQARRTGRQFGPLMQVGYVPDPFGHIGQMPQILSGFGITSACVQRGLDDEPCEFLWLAPDGSQVFMAYLRDGYSNAAELPNSDPQLFTRELCRMRDSLAPYAASGHILLMWGTDHKEASPGASRMIAAAQGRLDGDRLVHSSLPAYIEAARAALQGQEIPVVTGELRSSKRHALLPGVLSTRMWIKQRNRACETLLEKWAEPFSVWADLACGDNLPPGTLRQPAAILRQTWRLLMDNHPHDSICGSSIDQVHEEMRPRFDQVEQIGERITAQSLEALGTVVDTTGPFAPNEPGATGDLSPIVVFNPTARTRTDYLSLTFDALGAPASDRDAGSFDLVDETGASLPFETSGLGGQDLVNMSMLPSEFARAVSMVSEGRVAGMTLQEFDIHQEGSQVFIKIILSDKSLANLTAWLEGVKKIKACLEDPTVTIYQIHARLAEATHLAFTAADVPGFGYRTFWVRGKPGHQQAGKPPVRLNRLARALIPLFSRLAQSPLANRLVTILNPEKESRQPYVVENEFFRVEAARDGTLLLTDRRSGAVYPGLNRFVDGGDGGDEYNYSPPLDDRQVTAKLERVRVIRGQVRQTLELHLELDVPEKLAVDRKSRSAKTVRLPLVTRASLTAGVPRLDVHTELDNQACDHRLRVHFPAPFVTNQANFDGHFEIVRRPIGLPVFDETWNEQPRPEVPQRAFTSLSDGKIGLAVANRGLPEVEALKRSDGHAEIALTLLRSVGWLSRDDLPGRKGPAGPAIETPGAQMLGKWSFDYSILPFAGPESPAVYWQAYAFVSPLRAVSAPVQAGVLPPCGSFLQVEPQEFVVSAVKTTEDERGWLVRGYNVSDEEIIVKLKPWKPFTQVERANLAEEKVVTLLPDGNEMVEYAARGHEIVTILF